jgi:mannose/fructose/N-acetylgalactosamine-specific phosphotransferase system component IIC
VFALLLLLALGAWLTLDATAVGQFMVSRPLVAATLGGLVLGDPVAGVVVGALLEALHLAHIPTGGVRLPEPAAGALVAGAATAHLAPMAGLGGALALGFTLGLGLASLAGILQARERRATARRVERIFARGGSAGQVLSRSLALEALRGATVVALGLLLLVLVPPAWVARWPLTPGWTVAFLALPGLLGVGALGRIPVPGRGRGPALLAGGAAAGALLVLAVALVGGGWGP